MKTNIYRIKIWARVLITLGCLIFIIGSIAFILYNKEATVLQNLLMYIVIIICIHGIYIFNKLQAIIDEERIQISVIKLLPRTGILYWNEIAEVSSEYFLYPETGVINLIPRQDSGKTFLRITIWGMPIELVRDILSHLAPDTKIYLYPYLKRKVEGKQTWFYKT